MSYVVLLEADVFEESAVAEHVVLVLFISDNGFRVAYHVVVDIKMIAHEVARERQTHSQRYPPFHRPRIEIQPLQHHSERHIQHTKLMQFMQHSKEKPLVLLAASRLSPLLLDTLINEQTQPRGSYQQQWNVDIVDEETSHSCALETPVDGVEVEQSALVLGEAVHLGSEEVVGLAADLLPRWNIIEDGCTPETGSFVHVLRGYSVDE
jgi:hypothetical protein